MSEKTVSLTRAIKVGALPFCRKTIHNKLVIARLNGKPSPLPFLQTRGSGHSIRVQVAAAVSWLESSRWPHKAQVMRRLLEAPDTTWGQQ